MIGAAHKRGAGDTGPQTFRLKPDGWHPVVRGLIQLVSLGGAWCVLSLICVWVLELAPSIKHSPLPGAFIALLFLGGLLFVPLSVFLLWYMRPEILITVDSQTGMTVTRTSKYHGRVVQHYTWQDLSSTQMIGETSGNGMFTRFDFYLNTADGEELKIPEEMGSFEYFVDVINRSATHLPSWKRLTHDAAKAKGVPIGWYQTNAS